MNLIHDLKYFKNDFVLFPMIELLEVRIVTWVSIIFDLYTDQL